MSHAYQLMTIKSQMGTCEWKNVMWDKTLQDAWIQNLERKDGVQKFVQDQHFRLLCDKQNDLNNVLSQLDVERSLP